MIHNRRFAFVFRLCSLLFVLIGLMKAVGVFEGAVNLGSFMYYTNQSNLLAAALFAVLIVRMAKSGETAETATGTGTKFTLGSAGRNTRFGMVCAVDLLVTMVVFWVMLAPSLGAEYLSTFENIAVHTVTPLLCLLDFILFSKPRCLKYRDVYYCCIFPLAYVVFTIIVSLTGYIYRYENVLSNTFSSNFESVPIRYPYFFLDFDRLGAMVLVYIAGIFVFFLLISHGIYLIDRKIRKQPAQLPR